MKKITFKILAFLLVTMFTLQVQGQAFAGVEGIYKLRVNGASPETFLTQDSGINNAKYQAAATSGNEDTQLFTIVAHPSGTDWSITSQMSGEGALQPNDTSGTSGTLGFGTEAMASGQQDRWQFRDGGTTIFLTSDKTGTGWESLAATRRIQDNGSSAGDNMFFGGGTKMVFDFILVQTLSSDTFDSSSVFVSNPSSNRLTIKGLTSTINKINVYSLLGQPVLVRELKGERTLNLDISALSNGVYVVNFVTENGSFTKKIVKQ